MSSSQKLIELHNQHKLWLKNIFNVLKKCSISRVNWQLADLFEDSIVETKANKAYFNQTDLNNSDQHLDATFVG